MVPAQIQRAENLSMPTFTTQLQVYQVYQVQVLVWHDRQQSIVHNTRAKSGGNNLIA